MIRSFRGRVTQRLWQREQLGSVDLKVQRIALRKLALIDAALTLEELRVPPGNRLEKLKGDRNGQYSVRVNDQWRICFVWTDLGPVEVEFVDYH